MVGFRAVELDQQHIVL